MMAYKDQETARAAARRFREANPGYGLAQYAKHAEKRRAEKVAAYHEDAEASRVNQRQRYARTRERVREQQRGYYPPGHSTDRVRAWEAANPERAATHAAKRALRLSTGVAMRNIPDAIAEAKAVELEIKRAVKTELENLRNSSSREPRT